MPDRRRIREPVRERPSGRRPHDPGIAGSLTPCGTPLAVKPRALTLTGPACQWSILTSQAPPWCERPPELPDHRFLWPAGTADRGLRVDGYRAGLTGPDEVSRITPTPPAEWVSAAGTGFHAQIGVGDADCEHD